MARTPRRSRHQKAATIPQERDMIENFLAGPKSDAKEDAQEQDRKDGKSTAAKKSNKSRKEDKSVQNAFRPGPKYETKYDAEEQLDIYGGEERGRAAAPAA